MLGDAFNYKCWADKRTLTSALLVDERLYGPELTFICQQFNHMILVEEIFQARLNGAHEPHSVTNEESVPGLDELRQRLQRSNDWFIDYVTHLSPVHASESVSFEFVDGKLGSMSRREILFHIINHGTYHRGAIGRALDHAGGLRPADTYTVYIHEAQPQRRESR
jgi:uncharacterized damage-inducible protein DinB